MTKKNEATLTPPEKMAVKLISPAKIAGKIEPAGKSVMVDATELAQLRAAGAVDDSPSTEGESIDLIASSDNDAFEAAVAAKAKEIAETIVDQAVETAVTELQATADEASARAATFEARAVEAEAQLQLMQDRVLELQDQLGVDPEVGATDGHAEQPADQTSQETGGNSATPAKGKKTSSAQKS